MFWAEIWKYQSFFYLKIFQFLEVKFSTYLDRRVFVMRGSRLRIAMSQSSGHMAFIQPHFNIDARSWCCIDVNTTLYKRHMPTGRCVLEMDFSSWLHGASILLTRSFSPFHRLNITEILLKETLIHPLISPSPEKNGQYFIAKGSDVVFQMMLFMLDLPPWTYCLNSHQLWRPEVSTGTYA